MCKVIARAVLRVAFGPDGRRHSLAAVDGVRTEHVETIARGCYFISLLAGSWEDIPRRQWVKMINQARVERTPIQRWADVSDSDRKISERDTVTTCHNVRMTLPSSRSWGCCPIHGTTNVTRPRSSDVNLEARSGDVIPVWVQHSESQPERIERSRPSAKSHRLSSHRKSFGTPGRQAHS